MNRHRQLLASLCYIVVSTYISALSGKLEIAGRAPVPLLPCSSRNDRCSAAYVSARLWRASGRSRRRLDDSSSRGRVTRCIMSSRASRRLHTVHIFNSAVMCCVFVDNRFLLFIFCLSINDRWFCEGLSFYRVFDDLVDWGVIDARG